MKKTLETPIATTDHRGRPVVLVAVETTDTHELFYGADGGLVFRYRIG